MGFWSKLGKIGLAAAPYVAAPFTGGASLMATGATNKALQKWNEHDAKKAAEKGLGPSNFDKWLGVGSNVAGVASGLGAFGALGGAKSATSAASGAGKAANAASKVGGFADKLKMAGDIAGPVWSAMQQGQSQGQPTTGVGPSSPPLSAGPNYAMPSSGAMPQGGFDWNHNPINQYDQSNPNLATSIFQGRQEAIANQPWRSGYTASLPGREPGTTMDVPMPPTYPNMQQDGGQSYIQAPSIFGRRRNPAPE